MKVTCSQKELAFALNVVNRAVSTTTTLPVLGNVLMKAEGKKLFFSATNLEIAISYWINAQVKNEGDITVPAKLITSYVNLLDEGSVDMKVEEGGSLAIKAETSQTKIKGMSSEDFPSIPSVEKGVIFETPAVDLKKGIDQTVFAASTNTSRPVLSGIFFRVKKSGFKMIATDSYRLAEREVGLKSKPQKEIDVIVPARSVLELSKIMALDELKSVKINVSNNQIVFNTGNIELVSRLIEGKFPDYEKIIPKSSKTKVNVRVEDLLMCVRRVGLFVAETNNNVKIAITNDGKLVVSTGETQAGEGRAEATVEVEGENNKIALNAQYIIDVLTNIHSEYILFCIDTKISPATIKPVKEKGYIHIIMPLKL